MVSEIKRIDHDSTTQSCLPLTARIEVFRPGTFTPMAETPITYFAAELKAAADACDPAIAPDPIVVGHPAADAPALGWVESFEYDQNSSRLFANLNEIEPAFVDLVKAGRFKKVSMFFFHPDQGHNPVPGTWYPKYVGLLGAAAPAVSGLTNARIVGDAGAVFTQNFGAANDAAGLFRVRRSDTGARSFDVVSNFSAGGLPKPILLPGGMRDPFIHAIIKPTTTNWVRDEWGFCRTASCPEQRRPICF